jgi:uncharacterized protein YcsI (UPF0317 family)
VFNTKQVTTNKVNVFQIGNGNDLLSNQSQISPYFLFVCLFVCNVLCRYAIYRHGKLDKEVTDVIDYWPKESVAFLIGCSFSYDGELMEAGIPLKSVQQNKNVPMYKTNLKCRSAGSLKGNMVVSMKPIPSLQISKHVSYFVLLCFALLLFYVW